MTIKTAITNVPAAAHGFVGAGDVANITINYLCQVAETHLRKL